MFIKIWRKIPKLAIFWKWFFKMTFLNHYFTISHSLESCSILFSSGWGKDNCVCGEVIKPHWGVFCAHGIGSTSCAHVHNSARQRYYPGIKHNNIHRSLWVQTDCCFCPWPQWNALVCLDCCFKTHGREDYIEDQSPVGFRHHHLHQAKRKAKSLFLLCSYFILSDWYSQIRVLFQLKKRLTASLRLKLHTLAYIISSLLEWRCRCSSVVSYCSYKLSTSLKYKLAYLAIYVSKYSICYASICKVCFICT